MRLWQLVNGQQQPKIKGWKIQWQFRNIWEGSKRLCLLRLKLWRGPSICSSP
jgi:hypothetical protein